MHTIVRATAGFLGLVLVYQAAMLLRELDANTVYDIGPSHDTSLEFQAIILAELLFVIASLLYTYGGYASNVLMTTVSETIFTLLTLIPIYVLYIWRRRL